MMARPSLRGRCRALGRLVVAGLLLGACGGAPFHMRAASSEELPAPAEGSARVVFVMPENGRTPITIFDELGVYFGQLRGRTWTARDVAPGDHRFYVVRNVSGHVVHAEGLIAGRTYYVVAEDPLVASFRWRALRCDEDGEALRARASHVEPDPAVSEETVRRAVGDEPMRMHEADQRWDALTAGESEARTLRDCEPPEGGSTPASDPTPATDPAMPVTS